MYIKKLMAALAALLILTACNEEEADTQLVADSDYEVTVASYDKYGQLSQSFVQGEEITLVLSIKNVSSSTKTLSFGSSQQYDFLVRANGTELWRWSNDKIYATVISSYELVPGETKIFTAVWNQQIAEDGTLIPVGDYELGADRFGVIAWPVQTLKIQ